MQPAEYVQILHELSRLRADHDRRVAELLEANNGEVERRRRVEAEREHAMPLLGIDTQELIAEVERLLEIARGMASSFGAVNWGDLGVADIECRLSILHPDDGPSCVVLIEEAAPECGLPSWLHDRLDHERFPNVRFECEW